MHADNQNFRERVTFDRTEVWLLVTIVALGLLLRTSAIYFFHHTPESDEQAYRSMAISLLHKGEIIDAIGYRAMWNVGYPLFVIAPVFALFGENDLWVQCANLLLGGLSIYLCHAVAAAAGGDRRARLLASAFWAFYLPASVYTVYLFKENLTIPLVLGVVWCAYKIQSTAKPYAVALVCGLILGVLALVGNAGLAVSMCFAYALWRRPATWPLRLRVVALVSLAAIVVTAPWVWRNYQVFGKPLLNTNGGFNLYIGNNPAATGMFVSISETPRGPTWDALRAQGELHMTNTLRQEAIDWIGTDPMRFAELAMLKAAYFWKPPLHDGKGTTSLSEQMVRSLWLLQYLLLTGFSLAALLAWRRMGLQAMPLLTAILPYAAVHSLFYVVFRYRETIMPLLAVLAALCVAEVFLRRPRTINAFSPQG